MKSCVNAIRAFFEEKNRVWITRDVEALLKAGNTTLNNKWSTNILQGMERKRRSMRRRGSRLLRSHSKVSVQRIGDVQSAAVAQVHVDEYVTWVYRDGFDYAVESRVIEHHQHWSLQNGVWSLARAEEAFENSPLSVRANRDDGDPGDGCEGGGDAGALYLTTQPRAGCTTYDRIRALRYAELWWDGWNANFPRLSDDCTNFISQCLFAGQMPMQGAPNRGKGWWYKLHSKSAAEQWSYSWTTSHALYLHLVNHRGAVTVSDPKTLKIGDLIFYDWGGTGRYHHTGFVVDFDSAGDPLVNAHTDSSYHRHYLYLDSRALTPQTRYQFVHMPDAFC